MAATRSVDPETVIAQMRKTPVDDFFAHGGKVREDGRVVHDMYLMRIKKPEEFEAEMGYPRISGNRCRRRCVSLDGRGWLSLSGGGPKKDATGMTPSRPNFCNSLVQALRAPCCQAQIRPGGRSQRGDSAWCKTLDHLLPLLMKHQYRHRIGAC